MFENFLLVTHCVEEEYLVGKVPNEIFVIVWLSSSLVLNVVQKFFYVDLEYIFCFVIPLGGGK